MKDSSPADAEFIDAACHDPEFISAPRLPSAANLSSRAKLPRPENHRRSSAVGKVIRTLSALMIRNLFGDRLSRPEI